jgi:hypothetical protein
VKTDGYQLDDRHVSMMMLWKQNYLFMTGVEAQFIAIPARCLFNCYTECGTWLQAIASKKV